MPPPTASYPAMPCPPPGATIAVVAPASPAQPELLARVPDWLAAQGWQARIYPGCHALAADAADQTATDRHPDYLAAPDAQRLADLQAALDDPSVAAVWCLRGGYGSNRLLPGLDLAALQRTPKPLIGYSDISALHALLDQHGLLALHAPMPASDLLLPGHEADAQAVLGCLRQGLRAGSVLAPALLPGGLRVPGQARGRLVGGNLSTLAALVGTPWQFRPAGRLLFLEDVGEDPYSIDRLLWQLRHAGALQGLAGVLLGSFTEADDPAAQLPATLAEALGDLGVPVLGGWPSGHGTPNQPLPLGALATLDATAGTLTLHQDVLLPCT